MNIALLTIWHEMNYGAELQAYATIKMLQRLGHHVEMIDIRLSDCHKPNLNGRIGQIISGLGPAHKKFDHFWKKHIPVTRRYRSIKELQSNPPQADMYMVGSDQVWNPDITGLFAKLFFLDFGGNNVKRVSFASSFGTQEWESDRLTEEVEQLLRRFNNIGCREQSGVDILRKTFGVHSTLTIDPTLLFDEYSELTGPLTSKNTLVYYPLSNDPELMEYAGSLSVKLGLELVNNKRTSNVLGRFTWDRVGIEEWVRNIAESQFVITRSFHGLVFCILYRKPFAIIANKNNRGARLQNLLLQLGISDRYYDTFHDCNEARPWNTPIDYDAVHAQLAMLRSETYNYLIKALL